MEKDVVISVSKDELSFAELIENCSELKATSLSGAGIDGGSEYLIFLVPISYFTVQILIDLLKAHWDRAKHVKLEVDGMTVTGASLDEISEFLEKHLPPTR